MATNFKPIQLQPFTLAGAGAIIGDTQVVISTMKDIDGNALSMTDFGTEGYGTLEPNSGTQEESIKWTGLTNNSNGTTTLSGVSSVGFKSPYTVTSGLLKTHAGGTKFTVSNTAAYYSKFLILDDDETVNQIVTFNQSPIVPGGATGSQAINANQLAAATFSGASDASTTVTGLTRESVSSDTTIGTFTVTIASPAVFTSNSHALTVNDSVRFTTTGALPTGLLVGTTYYVISAGLTTNNFEVSATRGGTAVNTSGTQSGTHTLIRTTPIAVGTLDTRVPTQGENDALVGNNIDIAVGTGNKFVTQTGLQKQAENYAVDSSVSANTITIALSPTPTSYAAGMLLKIKVANSVTGSTTVNANSLGAVAIKKYSNGAQNNLSSGDILAGQVVTLIYESTSGFFIMQGGGANTITSAFYPQKTAFTTGNAAIKTAATAPTTGADSNNPFYIGAADGTNNSRVNKFVIDPNGGIYLPGVNSTVFLGGGAVTTFVGVAIVGNFLYACSFASNLVIERIDLGTLANKVTMTISGTTFTSAANALFSDGTFLYCSDNGTTIKKLSISGTTLTFVSSATFTSFTPAMGAWCDGTNVYQFASASQLYKWTLAGGSPTSIQTFNFTGNTSNTTVSLIGIASNTKMLVAVPGNENVGGGTTIQNAYLQLVPITYQ